MIEEKLRERLKSGRMSQEKYSSLLRLIRSQNRSNLVVGSAELYKMRYGENEHYRRFVERAKRRGDWFTSEEELRSAGQELDKILLEASKRDKHDYFEVAKILDRREDEKLYAAFVLNIPQVRDEVRKQIGSYDNLYRVAKSILKERRKNKKPKHRPDRDEGENETEDKISANEIFTKLLKQLPDNHFDVLRAENTQSGEYEDKKRLFMILKEKAKRECSRLFRGEEDPQEAITRLESVVRQQTNSNLRFLYEDQLAAFQGYLALQEQLQEYANQQFEHPTSGKRGVLPSFHQAVAIYHNLEEKRFGVFDDCGTGKTAIATLLQPLVVKKREREGKKIHGRTLVIGPKASSKAWSDGLEGELTKRYFPDKKTVAWVNGTKDAAFLEELKKADFVFANYEQLPVSFVVDGQDKKVYEVLLELGYDHLIIDEVQEAKNDRNLTKKGAVTEGFAVRLLATNPELEYLTLLSGTPMPDNLDDYATIFFMLKPEYFLQQKEEDGKNVVKLDFENIRNRFYEIYEGDPRALYTLTRQNTVRRTSEEVTTLPGHKIIEEEVELTPVQRKIVDYVFEKGKRDWLTQIRYAVLDPRLVSPSVLQEMELIGKLTRTDSAKYQRLEEVLADGPLAEGNKVVIFSSMFAEGVTREVVQLEAEYRKLDLSAEFERLGIRPLRDELQDRLRYRLGRPIELITIDGFTDDQVREETVDRLNDGLDGVVCTTKSGGVSLNFSAAKTGIFLDQHYSPAPTDQGIARINRRGQREKVTIHLLMGKDSIDYDVQKLVENKRENIQMALDGIELLDKEKAILGGARDVERLKGIFLKRRGGLAIDLSRCEVDTPDSFNTKMVQRRKRRGRAQILQAESTYEATIGQEIRKSIADDPVNCWHKEDFVGRYVENFHLLGPYVLARAKVADLVNRSLRGELDFPRLLLADAAGQGILYTAFDELENMVKENGFGMPLIMERDFSKHMHAASPNPHKYLADITGKPRVFDEEFFERYGRFDLVDCSSITLLPNKTKIRDYVIEANSIMVEGGFFQVGIGSFYFSKEFYRGMEESGFEPVVRQRRYRISAEMRKLLKGNFGQHYAQAYASKLDNTNFSIFRKVETVDEVDERFFLLENPHSDEDVAEDEKKTGDKKRGVRGVQEQISGVVDEGVRGTGGKKKTKRYTGKKRLRVDSNGLVVSED